MKKNEKIKRRRKETREGNVIQEKSKVTEMKNGVKRKGKERN